MEWPKLKNIIILILLTANLFLLAMVSVQERDTAQRQAQTLEDAVDVLARGGVRLSRADVPDELTLRVMTAERDQESEPALAEALLGACERSDLGGGRYSYSSALGRAEFRSNGNFGFEFNGSALPVREGEEAGHALEVLEAIGYSAELLSQEKTEGGTALTLRQTWQGLSVYACQVTLEYGGGCLRSISGQRLMGEPQPAAQDAELISVPTALVRFLNGVNDLGDVCNAVTGMTPGYLLAASSDAALLTPVWSVTTDTGEYTLNALTGALQRV